MSVQRNVDNRFAFALSVFANHAKLQREQITKNIKMGMDLGAILMQVELAREFDEAVAQIENLPRVSDSPPQYLTEQLDNNLSVYTGEEYSRWRNDYEREMELYPQ
jgi:hypothetical protein